MVENEIHSVKSVIVLKSDMGSCAYNLGRIINEINGTEKRKRGKEGRRERF